MVNCYGCIVRGKIRIQNSLEGVSDEFKKDDSEFREMFEKRSYKEFTEYMEDKYSEVRESVLNNLDISLCEEERGFDKSDSYSDALRKSGNSSFSKCKYVESLKFYYKSLAYARSDKNRALCYGNISAVFFKTEQLECCLAAIKNAKKLCSPEEKAFLSKISDRERRCTETLSNEPKINYPKSFALSYPENPKNSEVANCLQKNSDGNVITTMNLKMGDVIAVTKPFIIGGKNEMLDDYISCHNCWANMAYTDIYVCDDCTRSVYCSQNCKLEDSEFHNMICEEIYSVLGLSMSTELMALVFAFKLLSKGIDIRKQEYQDPKTSPFDWEQGSLENKVKAICSMPLPSWETYTKFLLINGYYTILTVLKCSKVFKDLVARFENGEELFFKTFWRGLVVMDRNSVGAATALEEDLNTYFDLCLGFLKHSCFPNVMIFRSEKSDVVQYIARENIKAGTEITVAYRGFCYFLSEPKDRSEGLPKILGRDCDCVACIKNWPGPTMISASPVTMMFFKEIAITLNRKGVITKRYVDTMIAKLAKKNILPVDKLVISFRLYKAYFGCENEED